MKEDELLGEVKKIINAHLGDSVELFLFGSRALGLASAVSDYDIGIDTGSPVDPSIMGTITEEIERLETLYRIDVVDFSVVSDEFKKTVTIKKPL